MINKNVRQQLISNSDLRKKKEQQLYTNQIANKGQ